MTVPGLELGATTQGFRLERLELYNWGTFHDQVWTLQVRGDNALVTGDIGSGKSTIVDAITTLLLPANRIAYNRAAGAESRERTLRSYVQGHYSSARSEATGQSRPVGLRTDSTTYSVLLGVFANSVLDATVTVAQVFWTRPDDSGQPERFYVTAESDLGIRSDFTGFGADINGLRRKLRRPGVALHDGFPAYGRDFRRMLGISSEQAMELFHQTVSMKSVGDLNDFVRSHMLELLDVRKRVEDLIAHFADLTTAHAAVRRAHDQLELLAPLLAEADRHDALTATAAGLRGQQHMLPALVAAGQAALLDTRLTELTAAAEAAAGRGVLLEGERAVKQGERDRLTVAAARLGGDRLNEIDRELVRAEQERDERRLHADVYAGRLAVLGLPAVASDADFLAMTDRLRTLVVVNEEARSAQSDARVELSIQERARRAEADELRRELESLRQRRSSIPARSLELRQRLCVATGIPAAELPFVGELIQVADGSREWEGAAERVLRGFALSLVVPQAHYVGASEWIDGNHLGARLVYHRVPAQLAAGAPGAAPGAALLRDHLDLRDSPFLPWLRRELDHRADHECAADLAAFRRAAKAVTRAGQVRSRGQHEKDDRRRIDDRTGYVLGWSNEAKIDALLARASEVQLAQNALQDSLSEVAAEGRTLERRATTLTELGTTASWRQLDWQTSVNVIAELTAERRRLEEGSAELAEAQAALRRVSAQLVELGDRVNANNRELGQLGADRTAAESELHRCRQLCAATAYDEVGEAQLRERLRADPITLQGWAELERSLGETLRGELDRVQDQQRLTIGRVVRQMERFRNAFPVEAAELDADMAAVPGFRTLQERLRGDDLPRFEAEFKEALNTNTIRDMAMLQAELNKQATITKERIATINGSLAAIEYNPGTYITLELRETPNQDIRRFRDDLRDCTDSSLGGAGDTYSEEKFLQVSRIVERFRGREGFADPDREWTRRVTDVRNWFVFSASERALDDGSEREHYTDSGGKSGGQKEKLAYTILAASLAYQFRLDSGERTFRFVVIDEAFGRGSETSTRFALRLFGQLGLQLLIVTPLQKIHVIEKFVRAVGFVDNQSGARSRLQSLTIEEYHARRLAHAALVDAG